MNEHFIADLVTELCGIEADEAVRTQIRRSLYKVGSMHGVRLLRQMERVDFAIHLLQLTISVSTIRSRLMATYDIGESQAYRDVQKALNLRHLSPTNGTRKRENCSIGKQLEMEYGESG